MTEDEAKTKWCPFARGAGLVCVDSGSHGIISTGTATANRHDGAADANSMCLGSGCMAWRHDLKPNPSYAPQTSFPAKSPMENPMFLVDTTSGHCGLAGRPS